MRRLGLDDFALYRNVTTLGVTIGNRGTLLPGGFDTSRIKILSREFGTGQRFPNLVDRCANVGLIGEGIVSPVLA